MFLIVCLGAILLGIVCIFVLNTSKTDIDISYVTTCLIREGNDIWEVRVEFPAGHKILYKNGEKVEVLQAIGLRNAKQCLELPEVNESKDIDEFELRYKITWNSNLEQSASYIKYLKEQGYREIRYAANESYIEIYLQKEDIISRILITTNSIMTAEVKNNILPDIKYYYQ